jgi:2-phospho-L-lactate guanylyltransferase
MPVAALSADLPSLRPRELDAALAAARAHPLSFVADVAGTGTTLYAALDADAFAPAFGVRSSAAHRVAVVSSRRDDRRMIDLWDALRLGTGLNEQSRACC